MDRIAIISDVHGNYEALSTVIKDIEKRNITRIFCLGDILGKGGNTPKCIELIKEKCEVTVIGNVDYFFINNASPTSENGKRMIDWQLNL